MGSSLVWQGNRFNWYGRRINDFPDYFFAAAPSQSSARRREQPVC